MEDQPTNFSLLSWRARQAFIAEFTNQLMHDHTLNDEAFKSLAQSKSRNNYNFNFPMITEEQEKEITEPIKKHDHYDEEKTDDYFNWQK